MFRRHADIKMPSSLAKQEVIGMMARESGWSAVLERDGESPSILLKRDGFVF